MPRPKNAFGPTDGFGKKPEKKGTNPVIPVRAKKDAEPTTRMVERPKLAPWKRPTMEELPEGWQEKFLEELALRPIATHAARKAGVSRRTAYRYKEDDPEFSAAWDDAEAQGKDRHLEVCQEAAEMGSVQMMVYLADKWNFPKAVEDGNKGKELVVRWGKTKKNG